MSAPLVARSPQDAFARSDKEECELRYICPSGQVYGCVSVFILVSPFIPLYPSASLRICVYVCFHLFFFIIPLYLFVSLPICFISAAIYLCVSVCIGERFSVDFLIVFVRSSPCDSDDL